MKCEECKAFSRQSEKGGTCHFTDFGTVMNEDGENCRNGRIVDSIYRRGRKDAIDELVDLCDQYCNDCYGECHDCHIGVVNRMAEKLKGE